MKTAAPAVHRPRHALAAARALRLVCALLGSSLLVAGCSVDAPQVPQFETQVVVPLGVRTVTGLDLIDDEGYVEGDSAGAAPLRFVLRGSMEEVAAGSLLDLDPPLTVFSFGLDGVRLVSERPLRADILLASLCDQFGPVPRDTLQVSIEPFLFPPVRRTVSPPEEISWVRLERGDLRITVRNHLPVPLGGFAGVPLRLRLRDHRTGVSLTAAEIWGRIEPGASAVANAPLAGLELSPELDLELSGASPGSGGVAVDVHAADHVELEGSLTDLVADSAFAVVPAQSFATGGTVQLAGDVEISEGSILGGTIRIVIDNPYPVAGTGRVTLPSVHRAADPGVPLFATIDVPAASGRVPGRGETTLDLAGAVVRPDSGSGESLEYRLGVETQRSSGPVRLGIRAMARGAVDPGRLSFDSIRGRLDRRPFRISPTRTTLDPPEGIDSLSFESASLALEITSTVAFPAQADLLVAGQPSGGGAQVLVPLRFSLAAAAGGIPRTTTVTLDETNSNILALLRARPRTMLVSGELLVGDGGEGTIRRTDRLGGGYTLSAPWRMRIGRTTHRTDPVRSSVSRDEQDLIRENVIEVTARGTVTNHFPAGLEVRLVFAGAKADLALDPVSHADRVLELDSVLVAPGATDAVTGRVVRARVTPIEVTIRPDQVAFFARDSLYSQAVVVVSGEDASRTVEVTALDFVEVTGMLHFLVRVKP